MKYFKTNSLTGNPANAVLFFFDKEIPLWIRLVMLLIGIACWGTLILSLVNE